MHQKFLVWALFALSAAAWVSCQKSVFDEAELGEHNAEFAFPLFSTSIQLQDLMLNVLNDTLSGDTIRINADNTMTLFYSGDVAQKKATDIFNFLQDGLVPVSDTIFYAPNSAPDSVKVYKVVFSAGKVTLLIFNVLPETVHGVFYIPQMSKNGVVASIPFTAPTNPTFPTVTPPFDLTGWVMESDTNALYFRYEAYLPNGDRVLLPEPIPGTPGVGLIFQNMKFSYLEGYWGYEEYPLTRDTIEIDINQTDLKGDIHIEDPKVTMTVFNSWGFPTRGVVKYLSFIGRDGLEYKLKSPVFNGDSLDFNYPSWIDGEVGQTKATSYYFDKTNSNIDTIFNAQPTRMIYEVAGISNAQRDYSITGFITDSSVIKLQMAVEMDLIGAAKNFGAEQELDLNFGGYTDLDTSKIESVEFKLVSENGTPIGANLQLYFQDAQGVAIDSLFAAGPQFVMQAAPVDVNGNVTGVQRTETFIPMSIGRFDRIRLAEKAYLRTAFTTANNGQVSVKLLANQETVVKMGVKVKTKLGN